MGAPYERLWVTTRTVRRDVDRLRRLGYPVDSLAGAGGGYRLGAGAALPPLLLDDDEAVAVAVGLRAGTRVAGVEEAALSALAKLEQVFPRGLRHRVAAIASIDWCGGVASSALADAAQPPVAGGRGLGGTLGLNRHAKSARRAA